MLISCPNCQSRYRIDPSGAKRQVARVKCPECQHKFEVELVPPTQSSPQETEPATGQPIVLIVDDAKFFREMIKDLLQDIAVDIMTAADGLEAWEMISIHQPQLVLLDLNIPGKSGHELLRDLRSQPDLAQPKVIVMSGVERGDTTASEMHRAGADDFISKSFKPRELQKRVRELLGL